MGIARTALTGCTSTTPTRIIADTALRPGTATVLTALMASTNTVLEANANSAARLQSGIVQTLLMESMKGETKFE